MRWNEADHPRDELGQFVEHARSWLTRASARFEVKHRDAWGMPDPATGRRYARDVAPLAMRKGFIRVADHPMGEGRPDTSTASYASTFGTSTHPAAGGLWIDPNNPGTRHAPNFRNDFGVGVSGLRPPRSRTQRFREIGRPLAEFPRTEGGDQVDVVTRRRGVEKFGPLGSRGNREEFHLPYISPQVWKRIMQTKGERKRQRTWIERLNVRMEGD